VQVAFQLNKLGEADPVLASLARTNEHNDENGTVAATFDIIVCRVRAALGEAVRTKPGLITMLKPPLLE
jgi:hypothetical protein